MKYKRTKEAVFRPISDRSKDLEKLFASPASSFRHWHALRAKLGLIEGNRMRASESYAVPTMRETQIDARRKP
jgi:hypothetical protein